MISITQSGKLMFTIIAGMAEFERDLIRERTIAGLERARARGKKLGRPRKKRKALSEEDNRGGANS